MSRFPRKFRIPYLACKASAVGQTCGAGRNCALTYWVDHHTCIHVIEGPGIDQLDFPPTTLLCWCSQQTYAAWYRGGSQGSRDTEERRN